MITGVEGVLGVLEHPLGNPLPFSKLSARRSEPVRNRNCSSPTSLPSHPHPQTPHSPFTRLVTSNPPSPLHIKMRVAVWVTVMATSSIVMPPSGEKTVGASWHSVRYESTPMSVVALSLLYLLVFPFYSSFLCFAISFVSDVPPFLIFRSYI